MRSRGFLMVLISLVFGFGAAWVAKNWLEQRTAAATAQNAGQQVVAAAIEIPYGTKVEARHVKLISLPKDAPLGDVFNTADDVIGKIATQKHVAGELLLRERFAAPGEGSTLAALVKPDMRAVTVRVDDVVGVAGFLLPGNHVDVIAARRENGNSRATTATILSDVNVLAVDQSSNTDTNEPVVVRAVTLEVTPQQAEVLMTAREEGRIQLTLRNPNDKTMIAAAAEHPEPAKKSAAPPRRSTPHKDELPTAPAGPSVTIIRGTNVNSVPAH